LGKKLLSAAEKVVDKQANQRKKEDQQRPKDFGHHVFATLENLDDGEDIENEDQETDHGTIAIVHK